MSSIAESWLKSRQEAIFSLCPLTREGSTDKNATTTVTSTASMTLTPTTLTVSHTWSDLVLIKGGSKWHGEKENHSLGGARKLVLAPLGLSAQTPNMRRSISTSYD